MKPIDRTTFRRTIVTAALGASLAVAAASSPVAAEQAPVPSDRQVDLAIRRGLDYLLGVQKPDGTWKTRYGSQHSGGVESLAILTALSAGESVKHAGWSAALEQVDRARPTTVYARAMRAMVYARLGGQEYAGRLTGEVEWLIRQQDRRTGGWGYGPLHPTTRIRPDWTDACNSQLAAMVLDEARRAGVAVPKGIWTRCRSYWRRTRNGDAGWGYDPPGSSGARLRGSSYGSMTAAGVATLFLIGDAEAAAERPSARDGDAIGGGLKWLAANCAFDRNPKWAWGESQTWRYFYLYCMQRVMDAAGLTDLGGRQWYVELTRSLLSAQAPDGSWGRDVPGDATNKTVGTCFALLALSGARAPFVVGKLALDAQSGGSRDAANLARWCARSTGGPAAWRMLATDAPGEGFDGVPILYVTGQEKFAPPEALKSAFHDFVRNGGTILVAGGAGDKGFVREAQTYFTSLFEDYHAAPLTEEHPVFNISRIDRVPVVGIGDQCRTRIFLLYADLPGIWHRDGWADRPEAFRFFANLVEYTTNMAPPAAGKLRLYRRRAEPPRPVRWITVARVKHSGDWNTNPLALSRVSDVLARAVSIGIRQAPAVDLSGDVPADVALLWMTGSLPAKLSPAQQGRLKKYLLNGGTLFVDSAMGRKEFFESASAMIAGMFNRKELDLLEKRSVLLRGTLPGGLAASDVTSVTCTVSPGLPPRKDTPILYHVRLRGRIAAVLSPFAVTCPAEGAAMYGCAGLTSEDALRLAANVVLYAASGM